jgi:hypothetical protein
MLQHVLHILSRVVHVGHMAKPVGGRLGQHVGCGQTQVEVVDASTSLEGDGTVGSVAVTADIVNLQVLRAGRLGEEGGWVGGLRRLRGWGRRGGGGRNSGAEDCWRG